ncbi:2,3-bisphosphoglycerate-independent phosphoglycerate mutase [Vittaforma corneae ATCC 50505]|uniref:phosphoglycerate mutase (2,3-diphosphoglycerate-independent) n=1 Tax=Vittaforma corneae (strain ATCC 50505) TaxID=993615 RepID=L2GPF7_VITCO|nr:2,3-bisphosphoglycerate-independent phosphoglycerate mutase [Vittaforma corneae ATCC 50505]ELA42773.1 2,3-bisphosphoglycerate-independent phosphoglycerate mutase [Vittaforma corneae ATCC 50505]
MKNVCLVIIDGYGISKEEVGNATTRSHYINKLKESNGYLEIFAHGKYVGLPDGKMGNSEVGHITIGSGRIISQSLIMIKNAFETGELKNIISRLKVSGKKIHLIGMISDGGVHSHLDHLKYLLECIPMKYSVYIHAIADGIDVSPDTFADFIQPFNNIVSISGRYFAMDRDMNYKRTEQVFQMMVNKENGPGISNNFGGAGCNAVNTNINDIIRGIVAKSAGDEFIEPTLLINEPVTSDDTVIFFNFRADRMRQLYNRFKEFCRVYTITEYEDGDPNAILRKPSVENTLSEWLSKYNKTQAHIAETEKYAHVTYFFNGGKEFKFDNEDWFVLPSPKVEDFTLAPGTSMKEVANTCRECIEKKYDFIVINLAAPDLLGHTGNFEKTVEAVSIMDDQIKGIHEKAVKEDYVMVITADHGNSEQMVLNEKICKSHTTNKVLFMVLNSEKKLSGRPEASLKDVAPTVLHLMGIPVPGEMTGTSLLE